jgi:hypothetical protein
MNNKLMDIYDRQYDEHFNKMLENGTDRQEAKNLMGLVFQKTLSLLSKKETTKESIEVLFNQTRTKYGIC